MCKRTNIISVFKCHAGLINSSALLKSNGVEMGYILIGQCSDIKNKQERFNAISRNVKIDNDEDLRLALDNIKYNKKSITSVVNILVVLTDYSIISYQELNK